VLLIVLVLNLIAAAMVLEFERGNPDANIASYPDALWWAVTTITTVGYGDRFPMSSAGRAVVVSGRWCKCATGVGSLEPPSTREDLHPWQDEYCLSSASAPRSTSCSAPTMTSP
jgi:hypothetical protein